MEMATWPNAYGPGQTPPTTQAEHTLDDNKFDNGIVGFLLGFFLPCLGIIIAFVIGGPSTKKGAVGGLLVSFMIWLCMSILSVGLGAAMQV